MGLKSIVKKMAANFIAPLYKKQHCVIALILVVVFAGSLLCAGFKKAGTGIYSDGAFAGSAQCKSCHASIYESHIKTAHYLTSRPASAGFIKGSFEPPANTFVFNKFMNVVMQKTDSGFFQSAYISGSEYQSAPFDIVIGSGRKGQTYLYWNDNRLFQLPVSYYTPLNSWCNSPGFSAGAINFGRRIPARCLECHGTYAKVQEDAATGDAFNQGSIMYGIDCERCHGPAAQHVAWQQGHPGDKTPKFIVNAKLLGRQQRLDACALCHSGYRKAVKPAFSYAVGDNLADFSVPAYNTDSSSGLDVHGNQYGLLTSSKCFIQSAQMDCSSCHNVHKTEINTPQVFSTRCINCHNATTHDTCTVKPVAGLVLADNCIDCHMPRLPSKKIFLQLDDPKKSTPDLVRSHRIAIYPEQAKAIIAGMKKRS